MRNLQSFGLLLLLVPFLLTSTARLGRADDSDTSGVDIVFIVDRSTSMTAGSVRDKDDPNCQNLTNPACPRTPPTDPNNLSLDAVLNGANIIFSQIAARRLARTDAGLQAESYRYGFIIFGTSACV
jgi:hypothetical protein